MRLFILCIFTIAFTNGQVVQTIIHESFHKQYLENDKDGWLVQNQNPYSSNIIFDCNGHQIFGGYDIFGAGAVVSQTFNSLPPHEKIKIDIQLWRLDSWDDETMFIKIDDQIWQTVWHYGTEASMCGIWYWDDEFHNYSFEFFHKSSSVNVILTSSLDQDSWDESWGFRDFTLSVLSCPSACQVCDQNFLCLQCLKDYDLFQGSCIKKKWLTKFKCFYNDMNIEGWQTQGVYSKEVSTLWEGLSLFGGKSSFGENTKVQKQFSDLPKHTYIRVKLQFYTFDLQNDEDTQLIISVDSTQTAKQIYQQQSIYSFEKYPIDFLFSHNQKSVLIQIQTTQLQNLNSWGFREFQLLYDFQETCVELYTECDFQGHQYKLCRKMCGQNSVPQIKSIKAPKGVSVEIKGNKYTGDQRCLV